VRPQAREYSSYDRWRADKLRERRGAWEPRRAFQAPLTAQQEIGWHAGKPAARLPSDRAKLSSTDVTRREGRTAVTCELCEGASDGACAASLFDVLQDVGLMTLLHLFSPPPYLSRLWLHEHAWGLTWGRGVP
jgi:hypothetical protein